MRHVGALLVSGAIATGLGWQYHYSAMVAAVTVLSGPDLASRLTRGLHRVVGAVLGLGVAAPIRGWAPQGVVAVLVIVVLQALTELVVGRNYAVALLFITPLALMMGQLVHTSPGGRCCATAFSRLCSAPSWAPSCCCSCPIAAARPTPGPVPA